MLQTVGVYVNILIDCVQLYYTYVGKQTVGVYVNILIYVYMNNYFILKCLMLPFVWSASAV